MVALSVGVDQVVYVMPSESKVLAADEYSVGFEDDEYVKVSEKKLEIVVERASFLI